MYTNPKVLKHNAKVRGGRAKLSCGHIYSWSEVDDMRIRYNAEGKAPQCPCCQRWYEFRPNKNGKKKERSVVATVNIKSTMQSSPIEKLNQIEKHALSPRLHSPPPWTIRPPEMSKTSKNVFHESVGSWHRGRRLKFANLDWTAGAADDMFGDYSRCRPLRNELPWILVRRILRDPSDVNATPSYPEKQFDDVSSEYRTAWVLELGFANAISKGTISLADALFEAKKCWEMAAPAAFAYITELARRRRVEKLARQIMMQSSLWRYIARFLPETNDWPCRATSLDYLTRITWDDATLRLDCTQKVLLKLCHCVNFVEETLLFVDAISRQRMGMTCRAWGHMLQTHKRLPPAIDLCFVLDTSCKMENYMDEAKSAMKSVVDKMRLRHDTAEIRVGCVTFRDYPVYDKSSEDIEIESVERIFLESVTYGWNEYDGKSSYVVDTHGGLQLAPEKIRDVIDAAAVVGPCSGDRSSRCKALSLALQAIHATLGHIPEESIDLLKRGDDPQLEEIAKLEIRKFTPEWRSEVNEKLSNGRWETMSWLERWCTCYDELQSAIRWNHGNIFWRKFAAKLVIVCSGSGPHGLEGLGQTELSSDNEGAQFDNLREGDPLWADPVQSISIFKSRGVTCHSIVCPPAINTLAVPFLVGLAQRTGGHAVSLEHSDQVLAEIVAMSITEQNDVIGIYRGVEMEAKAAMATARSGYGNVRDHYRVRHLLSGIYKNMSDRGELVVRRAKFSGTIVPTVASDLIASSPNLPYTIKALIEKFAEDSVRRRSFRIVEHARNHAKKNGFKEWKAITWEDRKRLCDISEQELAIHDNITHTAERSIKYDVIRPMTEDQRLEVEKRDEERRSMRETQRKNIVEHSNRTLAIQVLQKNLRRFLQRCRFTKQMKTRRKVNHEASDVISVEASVEIITDEIPEKELVEMLYRENTSKRYRFRANKVRQIKVKRRKITQVYKNIEPHSPASRKGAIIDNCIGDVIDSKLVAIEGGTHLSTITPHRHKN